MGMFHSHKGPQGTIGLSGLQAILTDCHHNPTVAEGLSCAIYEAFQLDKGARMSTREYALTLLALTGPEAGPYRAQVAFHAMDRVIGSGGAISPDDVKAFVTDMAAFSTALFSRLMTQFGKIFDTARKTPRCHAGLLRLSGAWLKTHPLTVHPHVVGAACATIFPGSAPPSSPNANVMSEIYRSDFTSWGEEHIGFLLAVTCLGYRSETTEALAEVTPLLACPALSLLVPEEVEAAMRSLQQRTGFGMAGLKAAADQFRQRAVRDRVTGRENFREVVRDVCRVTGTGMERTVLADTLYDFLAARSPDSVTEPGVDLAGFCMALLVLTGPECTHHRAEVAFFAMDTDCDGLVLRKDLDSPPLLPYMDV
jgi:hypothetical protein